MNEIRCRVKRGMWWMPPLGLAEALFILIAPLVPSGEPPKTAVWPLYFIIAPVAAVMLWGIGYLTLSLLREEIVAVETGLRWRGAFGPWKAANWEEISDFYLSGKATGSKTLAVQTEAARALPTLQTPHGALKISRTFTQLDELLPLIAARAVNAPAREWEIYEFRPAQGFSRRFVYWTKVRKWEAIWLSAGVGYLWIFALWVMIFSPRNPQSAEDWKWMWFPALLMIVLFGGLGIGALFGVWRMWRDRDFCLKHRGESVEVSLAGLLWRDGSTEIRASWSQIRSVNWIAERGPRGHYRVETEEGSFSVWIVLEQINAWVSLVRFFAPQLHFGTPYEAQRARLGTRWSGASEGEGAQIFGFRNSELRLMLVLPFFLSWMPLLTRQIGTPDGRPPLSLPLALICALVGSAAAFYGAWFFRSAAIWADEQSLEIHIPLRPVRRVTWHEIESLGRDELGCFVHESGRKTHLFPGLEPAGQNELLQLIARRATNATGRFD